MTASEVLAKGVERGIITAEQAQRLRTLESTGIPPELPVSPDDEQLRFISGFSDIFVTIGLAMFIGAMGYFALLFGGPAARWPAIVVTTWLLAEFFTRLRRMALPSIVLLVVFAVSVFMGISHLLGAGAHYSPNLARNMFDLDLARPTVLALAALITALVIGLIYFLGGVHFDRYFIGLGLMLMGGAIAISFVPRFGWTALGVLVAAGLILPVVLQQAKRKRMSAAVVMS